MARRNFILLNKRTLEDCTRQLTGDFECASISMCSNQLYYLSEHQLTHSFDIPLGGAVALLFNPFLIHYKYMWGY